LKNVLCILLNGAIGIASYSITSVKDYQNQPVTIVEKEDNGTV